MSQDFEIEILTPSKKLFTAKGSEALIPAYDGEMGILPGHADFIGQLGTGALKVVTNGDDFWFAVSGGVYQVSEGKLAIFAMAGDDARGIDPDLAKARIAELEKLIASENLRQDKQAAAISELGQQKARLEVHRRTAVVN